MLLKLPQNNLCNGQRSFAHPKINLTQSEHLILGLFDLNFESVWKKLFLHLHDTLSKLSGLIWKDTN